MNLRENGRWRQKRPEMDWSRASWRPREEEFQSIENGCMRRTKSWEGDCGNCKRPTYDSRRRWQWLRKKKRICSTWRKSKSSIRGLPNAPNQAHTRCQQAHPKAAAISPYSKKYIVLHLETKLSIQEIAAWSPERKWQASHWESKHQEDDEVHKTQLTSHRE